MALSSPIRVIIVDDSIIVRGVVSRILRNDPDIDIIATASDGMIAVEYAKQHKPDIMILDIEMPRKNGLEALPEIISASPKTRILMSSTLTARNAAISLEALQKGASDYLQKPGAGDKQDMERFSREIIHKIRALAGRPIQFSAASSSTQTKHLAPSIPYVNTKTSQAETAVPASSGQIRYPSIAPRALAIASSTGGPQALSSIFKELKGCLAQTPIFVTQHMPATFTTILATNLAAISGKTCKEGKHGDIVRPGHVYIAPGDYHMVLVRKGRDTVIELNQDEMVNFCRPAADPMIMSLNSIYGRQLLLTILTGMGHDGLQGAKAVHQSGGTVVAQDKNSSVVWGMPRAVTEANIASAILPLQDIPGYLQRAFSGAF